MAIPPELVRYLRDPVPEKFTVEILEDMHAVVDRHLVELARTRGSDEKDELVIQQWEELAKEKVGRKQERLRKRFGAGVPYAFVAFEAKMEFLVGAGHPGYLGGRVPDSVVEVMQEFMEIVSYPDEFE
ncbi:MAG: hypothetical protein QNJ00_16070 [Woeseiaceae bacterium]|nr:hypothetical protein [Woeseiaceae bacterium]